MRAIKANQLPNNLFDSADAWSSPVFAETGPDGAAWICDWYNLIVQHNPTPKQGLSRCGLPKPARAMPTKLPSATPVMAASTASIRKAAANDPNPKLDITDPGTLVAALSHPNLFWRLEAQRLLVETRASSAIAKLKEMAVAGTGDAPRSMPSARFRAWTHSIPPRWPPRSSPTTADCVALPSPILYQTACSPEHFTRDGVLAAADARELAEFSPPFAGWSRPMRSANCCTPPLVLTRHPSPAMRRSATHGRSPPAITRRAFFWPLPGLPIRRAGRAVNLLPNPGFTEAGPAGWSLRSTAPRTPDAVSMRSLLTEEMAAPR